ncbi:MAG: bifunctional adenosylcobinamide kinase/adenosylcobinamide-phosphate guanylyltransferase [Nitrospirae bacterium]|nr:MAG: bifunctional adenosylcobinamide kinase/adenosylcobinamide-phosphate guanylyltransferase [Nitrospirota bacterium]
MTGRQRTKVLLVLGGASSGKSAFALRLAERAAPRAFVATCEPLDQEMASRIAAHRRERGKEWETVEQPLQIVAWFHDHGGRYKSVVVDCLTLWLSNLLHQGESDQAILQQVDQLLVALHNVPGRVVLVSNEVGFGIVPEHPLSRRFRALAGTVNQRVAQAAHAVYLVVSGLSLQLK